MDPQNCLKQYCSQDLDPGKIPDPDPAGSRSEMNSKTTLVKTGLKIGQFLNEYAQLKNFNFFLSNIQPNTFTRREYKGEIHLKNIRKIHVGSKPTEKQDPDPKKIFPDSQLCLEVAVTNE